MLQITIKSFSFRKGIPAFSATHGGGFVFDCRGIDNPVLIEELSVQTGFDKAVNDYLETKTQMPQFLQAIWQVVDISVLKYIERGYDSLDVYFGCTGGQHRSVYGANWLKNELEKQYSEKIVIAIEHTNPLFK